MKSSNSVLKTITLQEINSKELNIAHQLITMIEGGVIAGGLPRDLLNGTGSNDIDLFIPVDNSFDLTGAVNAIARHCMNEGIQLNHDRKHEYPGYMGRLHIRGELVSEGGLDIIFIDDFGEPFNLASNFDNTLSQAWMLPNETGFDIYASELFQELNERKIIGIIHKYIDDDGAHVERVRARYPNYFALNINSKTYQLKDLTIKPTFGAVYSDDLPF